MLPAIRIRPDSDMQVLVAVMRGAARQHLVREQPHYAATAGEAFAAAMPMADDILSEGRTRILLIDGAVVSVVFTIDAVPGEAPVWHLSMGMAPTAGQEPGRVGDDIASRLSRAFGTMQEGPPEGVFRAVRHFRCPWLPDSKDPLRVCSGP